MAPQQRPVQQWPPVAPRVPVQHWSQQQQPQQQQQRPQPVQVPKQGWQAQQAQRLRQQAEEGGRLPGGPIILKQESEETPPKEEQPQVHALEQPQQQHPRQQHRLTQLLEAAMLCGAEAAPLNERMVAAFIKLLPLEQPKVSLADSSGLVGGCSHAASLHRTGVSRLLSSAGAAWCRLAAIGKPSQLTYLSHGLHSPKLSGGVPVLAAGETAVQRRRSGHRSRPADCRALRGLDRTRAQ